MPCSEKRTKMFQCRAPAKLSAESHVSEVSWTFQLDCSPRQLWPPSTNVSKLLELLSRVQSTHRISSDNRMTCFNFAGGWGGLYSNI